MDFASSIGWNPANPEQGARRGSAFTGGLRPQFSPHFMSPSFLASLKTCYRTPTLITNVQYTVYKDTQLIIYVYTLHVQSIYNYTTTALKPFCNDYGMIIHQRVPNHLHHLLLFKSGCCLSSPAIFLSSTCGLRGTAGLTAFISPAVTPRKLAWQWNITIFCRRYTFSSMCFFLLSS